MLSLFCTDYRIGADMETSLRSTGAVLLTKKGISSNMKKIVSLLLVLVMVVSLGAFSAAAEGTVKVGLITLHDENSTYDNNFIVATQEACAKMGAELVIKTGVSEGEDCYEVACDLADDGCDIVFADSFGHEDYMIRAAKEYPEVQFLHATGYQAQIVNLDNFHDAFASIYEGRYLAGVAAGLKLQEMIDNGVLTDANYDENGNVKVGYVGAYTYAEVISGYTSWFLGVRSVVPNTSMKVTFTGSWYDETAEKEGANTLIADGAALLSQHADSMGAPTACETAGVPDVTYNVPTGDACPNTYVIYSRINWAPYVEYAIQCVTDGTAIDTDWVGTFATDSVQVGSIGAAAAAGTEEALEEVKAKLLSGELHVFDCSTFTVNGETLTAETNEHVVDGYFAESTTQSAPYFDLQIDGISLLNTVF